MSAPAKNSNAIRHGLMASKLPPKCSYIRRSIGTFRTALEAEVIQRFREITTFRAALVQSACRHETRALLLQRYLREAQDAQTASHSLQAQAVDGKPTGLGIMDRAQLLAQISAATDARDKCLERLGLGVDESQSVIDAASRTIDALVAQTHEVHNAA
jgi:hypothetical protein